MKDKHSKKIKQKLLVISFLFSLIFLFTTGSHCLATNTPLRFNHVSLHKDLFNPKSGEQVYIFFHLSAQALITLRLYDRYGNHVRTLVKEYQAKEGSNKLSWDGCDDKGEVVPDEAYTFIIEAKGGDEEAVYDLTQEYGQDVKVSVGKLDFSNGKITYTLPMSSRVLVRLGVGGNGPLYKTLVNWQPRSAGTNVEYWDGWDETHTVYLRGRQNMLASFQAFALPQNAIMTQGNSTAAQEEEPTAAQGETSDQQLMRQQRTLASEKGENKPSSEEKHGGDGNGENKEQSEEDKEEQSEKDDEKKPIDITPKCRGKDCSTHADSRLIIARDIEVVLVPVSGLEEKKSDGNGEDEKPKQYKHNPSQGNCMIKVTIPDKDQSFTDQEQFEIISFVDDQFIEEVEAGISLPYDYTWDMSNIKKGSHILTVNVAGLKDHLGTASLAVEIEE